MVTLDRSPNLKCAERNIQLALELIAGEEELDQIDEVAELLGQFTCKKCEHVSKHTTHVC